MQNRYVGDIGDYGKYGMLRAILSNSEYRLGINWYLVQNETDTNDGKFTEYLSPTNRQARNLEVCDQKLYRVLREIVSANNRSVEAVQSAGILPVNTVYYSKELPYVVGSPEYQVSKRKDWFQQSLSTFDGCNVLFLDPDNGMEVPSVPPSNPKSGKYVLYREAEEYYRKGYNLIIYNHQDRTAEQEFLLRFNRFKPLIGEKATIPVLRFGCFSVRYYVFLLQAHSYEFFNERIKSFVGTTWGSFWEMRSI